MFKGKISWRSASGKFAYIDRKSVTDERGRPVELTAKKDIYVHQDDCPAKLYVGQTLIFETIVDPRRNDALRATKVYLPGPSATVGWTIGILTLILSIAAFLLIFPYQSSAGLDEANPLVARDAPIIEAFMILCMIPVVAGGVAFVMVMAIVGIVRLFRGSQDPDVTRLGIVANFLRGVAAYTGGGLLLVAVAIAGVAVLISANVLAYQTGIVRSYVNEGGFTASDHEAMLPWAYLVAAVLAVLGAGLLWMSGRLRKA